MILDTVNVALVDDHTLFRKTLKTFLSEQKNFNVIIHASDVFELEAKLGGHKVDVLIMDLYLPQLSGEEALKFIREQFPDLKIIVLSMCTDVVLINTLLDIGIYGYVSKADEPESLILAINSVFENRIYRSRMLTEALYWSAKKNVTGKSVIFDMRERNILQLLWEEKSNREIASEVFLSVRSVEKIRQDMKEKLGVKSTIGLLKYALSNNIIKNQQSTDVGL